MSKSAVAVAIAVFASVVTGNVLAQDSAVKMTKEELLAFLPGTKVTHTSKAGSLRRWTNEPDGKFVASSDNKKYGSAIGSQGGSHPGTWKINDEGKYCIEIEWKRLTENWCAYVLKSSDGAYYLNVADDSHRIEFSK
jgi:hypothetical protein